VEPFTQEQDRNTLEDEKKPYYSKTQKRPRRQNKKHTGQKEQRKNTDMPMFSGFLSSEKQQRQKSHPCSSTHGAK